MQTLDKGQSCTINRDGVPNPVAALYCKLKYRNEERNDMQYEDPILKGTVHEQTERQRLAA